MERLTHDASKDNARYAHEDQARKQLLSHQMTYAVATGSLVSGVTATVKELVELTQRADRIDAETFIQSVKNILLATVDGGARGYGYRSIKALQGLFYPFASDVIARELHELYLANLVEISVETKEVSFTKAAVSLLEASAEQRQVELDIDESRADQQPVEVGHYRELADVLEQLGIETPGELVTKIEVVIVVLDRLLAKMEGIRAIRVAAMRKKCRGTLAFKPSRPRRS